MVAIKRHSNKPATYLTGCNILICLVLAQVAAIILYFNHHPSTPPSQPSVASSGGLRNSLDSSIVDRRKSTGIEEQEQEQPQQQSDSGDPHSEVHPKFVESEVGEQGTHATDNFYFADYAYERTHPDFRHATIADWDHSHDAVSHQLSTLTTASCQYKADDHSILFHSDKCQTPEAPLVVYNAAHFERFWCGTRIAPGTAVQMSTTDCNEPVKLFPVDRPGMTNMPPIVVTASPDAAAADLETETLECDIPCEYQTNMKDNEMYRYIQGTEWKIIHTMRDPKKQEEANVERTAFRDDIYYSTTSFKSSVPLSHFSFDEYDIFTPALDYDSFQEKTGSYLVDSLCASHFTKRNRWADAIAERLTVDAYGQCMHNKDFEPGMKIYKKSDRLSVLTSHLFNMAFEFGDAKDHITGAVWEAFASGTLPVVLGASNLNEHLPKDSYLSTAGLSKWGELGEFVEKVVHNKDEYEKYHKWRTDPAAKKAFDEMYNFTRTTPECRLCRWAYAKRYGLGWSHQHQYVHDTAMDRNLCLDDEQKLVASPFVETWYSGDEVLNGANSGASVTCSDSASSLKMSQPFYRSVTTHDNVVDIDLTGLATESSGKDLVLRLKLPVENFDGSYFPNPHNLVKTTRGAAATSIAIQDAKSKVMVVASWNTVISTKNTEGVVDIVVRRADENLLHGNDEVRRIRVIIEDMVELYDKATEYYPTSYAKLMVQDFCDPLELFYVE